MQVLVRKLDGRHLCLTAELGDDVAHLRALVEERTGIPAALARLVWCGRDLQDGVRLHDCDGLGDGSVVGIELRLVGGMDFQNRVGSKFGGGGVMSESQANADRRERLRKLALETIDLNKDPYFMRNHLGKYECKLCLTLHNNEGNYLAHTQGKRHQENLARRAAMEARNAPIKPQPVAQVHTRSVIKIGRPGYKADDGVQPRHRFMSAYEQRVEAPDKRYQYILFACDPYETIAFKVPNAEVDKKEGRFYTNWDRDQKKFSLRLYFNSSNPMPPGAVPG